MSESKLIEVLFAHLAGMSVEHVGEDGGRVPSGAVPGVGGAACLDCATTSSAVQVSTCAPAGLSRHT